MSCSNTCGENDQRSVQDLFDRWAVDGMADRAMKEHEYAVRQVLEHWSWEPTDSYLDIGCGSGYSLRIAAPFISRGRVTGVDLSEKMIEKAQQETRLKIPVQFYAGDFTLWDSKGERFDKIFSMEAFYYFPDVMGALRKARSLLKKGGLFACIVDYYQENAASHNWPKPENCGVPMQLYNMKTWKEMFAEVGLKNLMQKQIRYPRELALDSWQVDVGSLMTQGSG